MALRRRQSVPIELASLSPVSREYSGPLLSSYSPALNPYLLLPEPGKNKLLAQAETLAGMTFELSLRNVNARALRLERDVQRLVMVTADDPDFRRENEARLMRIMREVEAVKARMARCEGRTPVTQADIGRMKQEMNEALRAEVNDLKVGLRTLTEQIGRHKREKEAKVNKQTSSASTTQTLPALQSTLRMETRAGRRQRLESGLNQQQELSTPLSHEHRITEAINSTKRWNREHKAIKCSDPEFIVSYLMKQGRRDPGIAKVLQQAIQKRASRGIEVETGEAWRPRDLKELCQNVTWRDVIDAATEVLVTKRHRTVQLLRQI